MSKMRILEFDDEAQEAVAEITVSVDAEEQRLFAEWPNQEISLKVCGQPVSGTEQIGQTSLLGLLVSNIVSEEWLQPPIKTDAGYFSYHLYAKVHDSSNRHVRLGDIDITFDTPIPKDIVDGSMISFDVQRLDL